MRRLILLRHGQTALSGGADDLDRSLTERGREAAPKVGATLAGGGPKPDLALVSPARRTRETWDLVRPALGEVPSRVEERIYEASAESLLALVRETAPRVLALLLVGHNPGLEDLATLLAAPGSPSDVGRMNPTFPPAGLAILDLDIDDWREAKAGSARLDRFIAPPPGRSGGSG